MISTRLILWFLCGLAACAAATYVMIRPVPGGRASDSPPDPKRADLSHPASEAVPAGQAARATPAGSVQASASFPTAAPAGSAVARSRSTLTAAEQPSAGESARAATANTSAPQPRAEAANPPAGPIPTAISLATTATSAAAPGDPEAPQTASAGNGSNESATPAPAPAGTEESNIPVPAGAIVPAILYDNDPKTPQQQAAVERIISEFEKNISEIPSGYSPSEVWEAARHIADERYLTLFGYEKFNQTHLSAAKEALKERRATAP